MFDQLRTELDQWDRAGRTVRFWLRDDDAVRFGPKLQTLFDHTNDRPIGLAVIPDGLAADLASNLPPQAAVLQHGATHANHAAAGEKKAELGAHRPLARMTEGLAAGKARLSAAFADRFLAVLVPPWNRISADLLAALPGLGFAGVSIHRDKGETPNGLIRYDTHLDPVDWRGTRGFIGWAAMETAMVDLLRRRRHAGIDQPIGLLLHHRDFDTACLHFLQNVTALQHSALLWDDPVHLFASR